MNTETQTEKNVRKVFTGVAVITNYIGGVFIYDGPDTVTPNDQALRNRGTQTSPEWHLSAPMDVVAPADEARPNLKDPRINVVKDEQGAQQNLYTGAHWRSETDGETRWFYSKEEAVENTARRLAILDWHNAG